jgi:hypothetical protein
VIDPFRLGMFAWQAATVIVLRSLSLASDPCAAGTRLFGMAAEKQRAFARGYFDAWSAVMRGARPDVVAEAALRPARRRVAANARSLLGRD